MTPIKTLAVEWAKAEKLAFDADMGREAINICQHAFYMGAAAVFRLIVLQDATVGTILNEIATFGSAELAKLDAQEANEQRASGETQQ